MSNPSQGGEPRGIRKLLGGLYGRWEGLSRGWRVAVVGGGLTLLVGSSIAGYRQWHYMQHDNGFCLSCHLMSDPFERFNRSAHSKIECHDCHRATMQEQLHQLTAVVFDNPTEIKKHAHVPNERCETCHVQGDSTRWEQIQATAGHRVHLESGDSALLGMMCTDCHSVSVHEFASADRTCLKSGCHPDAKVYLGRMGDLQIYCTTCHNFLASAPGLAFDSLGQPLTPQSQQCFSCHEMRQRLAGMEVAADPHRGVCGDCHNAHDQREAREVGCATATCHADWRSVSFHVGVPHPEQCATCHLPHSWRVDGQNCLRCHARIGREAPTRRPARQRSSHDAAPVVVAAAGDAGWVVALHAASTPAPGADQEPGAAVAPAVRPPRADIPRFSHGDHRGQTCASCHSSRVRHGELLVKSGQDCQRCHHAGPTRQNCVACHAGAAAQRSAPNPRTMRLTAGGTTVTRRIRFDHLRHGSIECAQCHTDPLSRTANAADCTGCHAQHHTATSDCVTCHASANALATHRLDAHGTCASAGCHAQRAAGLPSSREACLVCHQAQQTHQPGKLCDQCHQAGAP